VTLADTKRVAKRLLDGGLLTTVVGRPDGVTSTDNGVEGAPAHHAKPSGAPVAR